MATIYVWQEDLETPAYQLHLEGDKQSFSRLITDPDELISDLESLAREFPKAVILNQIPDEQKLESFYHNNGQITDDGLYARCINISKH